MIAGDERWIEPRLAAQLRRYVDGGGRLFSLGTDSLRRKVRLSHGTLVSPTGDSSFDIFGYRPAAGHGEGRPARGPGLDRPFRGHRRAVLGVHAARGDRIAGPGAKIVLRRADRRRQARDRRRADRSGTRDQDGTARVGAAARGTPTSQP